MIKILTGIVLSLFLFLAACSNGEDAATDATMPTIKDSDLYLLAKTTTIKTFYKLSVDTLLKAGNSAHPAPKLRTWYNTKAATQLDVQGKVKSGAVFPDSSLIVKEIYNADGTLGLYAVLYKLSAASNKGLGNWVWNEMEANGNPLISASDKGAGCASCHSAGIDYTRMNDTHP